MRKVRSKLICGFLCVGMVLLLIGEGVFAEKVTTLRLGHIFPLTHPVQKAAVAMAEYVKEKSNGKLIIDVYANGALGKGNTLAENISFGTVDMGTAGPGLLMRLEPAWGLIAGEYVFKSVDCMFKVLNGPIGDEIKDRLIKKRGIRVIGIGYLGKRHLTCNKPIYKPEDLRGLKIRIPNIPLRRASFIALGASPTPMAFSEVYLALRQGVVDGQENPLAQIVAAKFYEVQKYLILTGHALNPEILLINEKRFESLPEEYQSILLEGARVYEKTTFNEYNKLKYEYLEKLLDEGMIIMKPDVEAFREAVKDVPYQFEKEWGKGLYDKILKAQEGCE
ncbi:C4-dicarboxylate ABC transporter substrate-binding protein [Candidatus Aerophobetes bacterium]|uniref:C4-dicarboxylate ABC transporter substrate-binding protein n=1 Tax=Aerophobetes bacterium TaxID=2030807 RepID=A0A662DB87_UNCAE|nr:MAG: C4-dicarboxylate ABC transporter substrate-binding protein [Candidatus Aerophobetes bacterium]